mgnify:CR=1 FL=1
MKKRFRLMAMCCLLAFLCAGCAYRYYVGMHGPSVKQYPEVHTTATLDEECLKCHHPDRDPEGPATTHPGFTGCLKCHNDDI